MKSLSLTNLHQYNVFASPLPCLIESIHDDLSKVSIAIAEVGHSYAFPVPRVL